MAIPSYEELEKRIKALEAETNRLKQTEEALKKSEEQLRAIFESADDFIFLKDRGLRYVKVNPAMEQLFGKPSEDLIGRTDTELCGGEAARQAEEIDAKVLDGEWIEEEDTKPVNGMLRTLHVKKTPVRGPEGRVVGLCGIARDISEGKQAQEDLAQIFHMSLDMICIADLRTATFLKVNPAFTETLGFTEEELLEKSFLDFVHPDDVETTQSIIADKLLQGGRVMNFENRYRCKDGSYRWLGWVSHPNPEKGITYAIARDITENKRAEKEIRKVYSLLDATGRMARVGGWELDAKTLEVTWTDETYRIHEVPLGRKPSLEKAINFFHPSDRDRLSGAIRRALEYGEPYDMEIRFITAKGNQLWTRTICHPQVVNGKTVRLLGTFQDVTEQKEAFALLENRNTDLKLAQRIASIGTWTLDPEIGIPEWSDEIYRIYERDPNLGPYSLADYKTVYRGKWWERFNSAIQRAIEDGTSYDIELKLELPSGGVKWVHAICEPEPESGPKGRRLRGTIQDITARKQADEALRHSEAKYRELADMLPQIVFETDEVGNLTFVNQNAFDAFGYTKDEFAAGLNATQMIAPKDRDRAEYRIRQIATGTSELVGSEYNAIKKDGTEFPVIIYSTGILRAGSPAGLRGIMIDITDQKHAEKKLISLKRRNQALLDYSPVCHKIVDLDFNLQYMSANGFKLLKLDDDSEVYGKPYPFEFFPTAFQNEMKENLRKAKDGGKTIVMEALANDVEGNKLWLESTIIPVLDDNSQIEYLTVVSADTTQRKDDEKAKQFLEAQLRQAQKMEAIGTLAGGIAHDFNNILTPVIIQTELALLDVADDGPVRSSLQEILEAGYRAKNLVKQILTFSRQTEAERVPLVVAPIVKEALKLLRSTLPTTIRIEKQIEAETGNVLADPTKIHQVLMNLCTNAGHAMHDTGGVLTIGLSEIELDADAAGQHQSIGPGRYVKLTVADTGHGIAPSLRERIFEPFFTTKDRADATGMGLSVVHGIVESCGGSINLESEVDQGTTFTVLLPSVRKRASNIPVQNEELPRGNERVLVVDDEQALVNALEGMLRQLGYTVVARTSSIEALEEFKAAPEDYDLVITDQTMSNMTGVELSRALLRVREDLPIILCTGFSDLVDEEKAKKEGIKQYVLKPIITKEMANAVRSALEA